MECKNFKETVRKNALKRELNEAVAREYLRTARPDLYREGMTVHNADPESPLCTAMLDVKTKLVIAPDEGVYEKRTAYGTACKMYPEAIHVESGGSIYLIVGIYDDGVDVRKFDNLMGCMDLTFKTQRKTFSNEDGSRYFLDNRKRIYFAYNE